MNNNLTMNELKYKYEKFVNHDSEEKISKLLSNQQNMCYICCCDLDKNDNDQIIIKTKCNHLFHYDCLKISHLNKTTMGYNYYTKKECPYCRTSTGWLPLLKGDPEKNVHKEYYELNKKNPLQCKAIIKSGKKKGQMCGCIVKVITQNKCCGRHKNYVFPVEKENPEEINLKKKEFLSNWYKGKILNCY